MITVLYFAAAREATEGQIASEQIALPPSATTTTTDQISVAELKRTLAKKHGKVGGDFRNVRGERGARYCESDEDVVRSGDEVAIIPPISGG